MYTKLFPETVHYISFTSKFVWNHLSTYHFYHLFEIIYKVFNHQYHTPDI